MRDKSLPPEVVDEMGRIGSLHRAQSEDYHNGNLTPERAVYWLAEIRACVEKAAAYLDGVEMDPTPPPPVLGHRRG